ncbi:MAG: DUF559 domain-containing protein [Longimicrobiales bacterium]
MRPKHRTCHRNTTECGVTDAVERERAIADIAARQRGVVSARQLREAGFGESAIKRRLRGGRLHRLYRGVYLVGHAVAAEGAVEMGAVIACGNGSVVSHWGAARLWGFASHASSNLPVDVTVPGRDPGPKRGIRVYRVRHLERRDVRSIRGIPVTSPARTLLDLAAIVSSDVLECAMAEARVRKLVSDRDIADQLERNPGRRGASRLRRLLDLERGPALTRSEAERRLAALLRAASLPAPETNVRVNSLEVDFLWRKQRVVVEVDGYAYHSNARAFERDRERDASLVASGNVVIRFTWRQLTGRPEAVVARVAAALALRAMDGSSEPHSGPM